MGMPKMDIVSMFGKENRLLGWMMHTMMASSLDYSMPSFGRMAQASQPGDKD
jgi:hypothetical protein